VNCVRAAFIALWPLRFWYAVAFGKDAAANAVRHYSIFDAGAKHIAAAGDVDRVVFAVGAEFHGISPHASTWYISQRVSKRRRPFFSRIIE
jgi:hypothetical protein